MSGDAASSGVTSIIIVAADSGPLLGQSVESALASSVSVEVVVVDNASADGEPERVRARYANDARVRVLVQDRNIGFGPACNRGAAVARGDAFLFLNPDCAIEPGTVAALRGIAAGRADCGVLGVEVLTPDGKPARGNRRREPTFRRALMTMTGLSRLQARWSTLGGVEMPAEVSAQRPAVEDVEAISGACMFVPRRVFEAIGGFDERYFLHVEDLDLCRRVRDAGYAVAIANTEHAIHAQGASSRHRPLFVAWHKHRGMWRYFAKFDRAARNPLARWIVWVGIWAHFVICAPALFTRLLVARRGAGSRETARAT